MKKIYIIYRFAFAIMVIIMFASIASAIYTIYYPTLIALNYHDIEHEKSTDLFAITPEELKEIVKLYIDSGYVPLSKQDFEKAIDRPFFTDPQNSFIVTFDDGKLSSAEGIKLLKKEFGINSAMFIITDMIGVPPFMDEATIKDLHDNYGCIVGLHGKRHDDNIKLLNEGVDLTSELSEGKRILENLIGETVDWYAYPYGECSKEVEKCVKDAGLKLAFNVDCDEIYRNSDKFNVNRLMFTKYVPIAPMPNQRSWIRKYSFIDFLPNVAICLMSAILSVIWFKRCRKKQNSL